MSKSGFDIDQVRQLAELLKETDLAEIEIEVDDVKMRLAAKVPVVAVPQMVASAVPAAPVTAAPVAAPAADTPPATEDLSAHPGAILSPMVGTAYLSSEPDVPVFIKVGDSVSEGQTLLIIEAMKTMNPIPATKAGKVTQILVENEQPIEYGQPLVIIE